MGELLEFVGDKGISSFSRFFSSTEEGVDVVIGCYLGVVEGVDMWFPHDSSEEYPRFRLEISVGDLVSEAVFVLFDDVVRKVACETCKLLLTLKEGSTLYPNEAEDLFGDPLLFKVVKKKKEGSPGVMEYEVIGVLNHPSLLNIFYNPDHPAYGGSQTAVSVPVLGEAVAAGGCEGRPPNVRGSGMLGTVGDGVVSLCGAKVRGVKRSRDEASVCGENGDGYLPSKAGRFVEE